MMWVGVIMSVGMLSPNFQQRPSNTKPLASVATGYPLDFPTPWAIVLGGGLPV